MRALRRAGPLIGLPLLCLLAQPAMPAGSARAMGAAQTPPAPAAKTTKQRERVAPRAGNSVVLAFVPAGESELASVSGLSVGLMSATQGRYTTNQMLLDVSQGARVAASAYGNSKLPELSPRPSGAGAIVAGWQAAVSRAAAAPQLLRPGLLAASVPDGAAYAGVTGVAPVDAVAAADRAGRLAAISLGSAPTRTGATS